MLASLDLYRLGHVDHLLPQSKYPQLKDDPSNHVLSCLVCNYLKSDWDPNAENSIWSGSTSLVGNERAELIERAKTKVAALREKKASDLSQIRKLIAASMAAGG